MNSQGGIYLMSGGHSFRELTKDFSEEPRAGIDANWDDLLTEHSPSGVPD